MLSFLQKIVRGLKPLIGKTLAPVLSQGEKGIGKWLILANILLVFFLILLSNTEVLPFKNWGDFGFFAAVTFIFALYRPGWAFLFFIGTIMLENINLAPESLGINVRPYQFLGALTIIAVLIRLVSKRLNFNLPKMNWSDKAIIVFAAAGFVSVLGAANKSLGLKYSVIILSFAALYFLVRLFIQNIDDIKKILPFFLSSSAVVILYGIWQNARFMSGLESFETMPGRPNATFAEADWLGTFLVFLLAIVYSLLFHSYKFADNQRSGIFNFQFSIFNEFSISKLFNLKLISNFKFQISNFLLCLLLTACYILLILTVSRSAWLGAIMISIMYYVLCIMYFLKSKNVRLLWISAFAGMTFASALGIVAVFNLTNFELGNRLQSAGSGLQKITVACADKQQAKELQQLQQIEHLEQLEHFSCWHINLEEIEKEKAAGNAVAEIYRDDPNVNARSEIYRKSWGEIKKRPVRGIGWGNISEILGMDERGAGLNSSNIFLEVWLGAGVLGLASFIFILLNILIRSIYYLQKGITNYELRITNFNLFLLLSFFAILIPNLFNAGIMLGFLWVWLGIAQMKQFNNETI
ncbi:O-antigen ligase family protein [bacterium]|nr:O-antigen ligase family protein [bacterium]